MSLATTLLHKKAAPWWLSGPALLLFTVLLLVPLALTAVLSFNAFDPATGVKAGEFTLEHYAHVFTDSYYHAIFWRTFWPEGLVNVLFGLLGFGPVKMLYTEIAVVIALVHVMLPFMVIPVWTSLQKLDPGVENAALSLQATPFTTLRRIVLPQVLPGILSGSLIVFGLAASSFAIPGLLGGRRLKMVATVVYDEYLHELNWPLGAAIALTLLVANLVVMLSYNRLVEGRYKKALG